MLLQISRSRSDEEGVFMMKRYVNELTIFNRSKFKLASGIHGLESELSRWVNRCNIYVCCELDKEESVEHFLLECPLYNEIRDEILLQISRSRSDECYHTRGIG
eukprot:Awhi_evm1s8333